MSFEVSPKKTNTEDPSFIHIFQKEVGVAGASLGRFSGCEGQG